MKKTTKSRIGGAVAALAVRAAVAKKIVAGSGIAAVVASLVACSNPTDPAYDADAVRAEVEAWMKSTYILSWNSFTSQYDNVTVYAELQGSGDLQEAEELITSYINQQLTKEEIANNILSHFNYNLALTKNNNKFSPLNKKQYLAAANRNAKSVVAASRTRARIG